MTVVNTDFDLYFHSEFIRNQMKTNKYNNEIQWKRDQVKSSNWYEANRMRKEIVAYLEFGVKVREISGFESE